MEAAFSEPVLARVPGRNGGSDLIEIRTVRDGLRALNRGEIGGIDLASSDWHHAAVALQRAIRHPCENSTEEARTALVRLARRTKARLDS